MSFNRHASASHRTNPSRDGYSNIPPQQQQDISYQPNDHTVEIPLERYQTSASSNGGRRTQNHTAAGLQPAMTKEGGQSDNAEKRGLFRGRRAKISADAQPGKGTGKVGYDGEEDTVTTMGKIYNKIVGFSIVTRYMLYTVPVGILIAVPIVVGAILEDKKGNPKIGGVPIVWLFSWVLIIWCSLWISKIVAHFLPFLFQMVVGVVSAGTRKYATVLRKLEIPLSLVGWAVTSLATFKPIMTRNPYNRSHNDKGLYPWVDIVQKLLGAAVVASLVFLAEKTIIQLISINYHRKQFTARIKESKRKVYILGLLYDASRALFPMYCQEFMEEDYLIADQLQLSGLSGSKKKGHKRPGSATPLRFIHDIGRIGDQVTSAFGNMASEITGREVFNPHSSHSVVVEALEKKRTSEALARRIWMSLVVEGKEALKEEDIIDVLGPERKTEAEEAYWSLDRDGNGDISLDEMIMTVTEFGRERKAIANSMVDVASAINVLDNLLCTVVLIAVVFIVIAFLNTNFVTTLATAGTALLSLSFVFSVTAQEFLGSCIFLFVKHPFDVGDRVDIAGDPFTVEHISLLFTVFRRAAGLKTGQLAQYPNILLNSLALENVSRSSAMTEQITLDISFDTSFDDIQILRNELEKFVNAKENNRDFQPDVDVEVLGTSDMSKLQLKVDVRHKSNWSNETLRAARRSKFMCALVAALRAVPIYCPGGGVDAQGSAAAPNYNVAISDTEAKENAQHAAEEREKARLIAQKKIDEAKARDLERTMSQGGMNQHDIKVVNDLTSRDPQHDIARDDNWGTAKDGSSSSTAAERDSIDQQDLNEVRGLLRRESTRGKRKPSSEQPRLRYQQSIPTINEPNEYTSYGRTSTSFEGQRPTYSTMPAPYRPDLTGQQFRTAQQVPTVNTVIPESTMEMSQVDRSNSNPYRNRSESVSRKPLSPTAGGGRSRDDDDFDNARPYSGV